MPPNNPFDLDHDERGWSAPHEAQQSQRATTKMLSPLAHRFRGLFHRSSRSPNTRSQLNISRGADTVSEGSRERGSSLTPPRGYVPEPQNSASVLASTLQGAHNFRIGGNSQFVNTVNNYAGTYGLETLKEFVSFSALHDSSAQDPERRCHPGTRESVLNQIRDWIEDANSAERILWLYGPAGVGKSAIAQTISQSYGRETIAATFFFFRSDPIRNDANRLFPTLVWQLAFSVPDAKDHIIRILNGNPDLPRKAIEIQLEKLVVQPFQEIATHMHISNQVVIIDGLDECSDNKLQQRLLAALGQAVENNRIPLRLLISSRPEAHIEDAFKKFQPTTLNIDLAEIDGAYQDVEKYLKAELSRIAFDQDIDPGAWPGQKVIDSFVSKSSGQFVYAYTVIKFIGDEYSSATSQLDIILGLEPNNGESPFVNLDALYLEILKRQHDQKILKEILGLLLVHSELAGDYYNPHKDDSLLLGIDEKALHRKLRGMHSLLKFDPWIDVHHRSFLDFLQEESRSHQYHIGKLDAKKRYLWLIVDTLVRRASKILKQHNCHETENLAPAFGDSMRVCEQVLRLPLQVWEEQLVPLISLEEDLVKLQNLGPPWRRGSCRECSTFHTIEDLLLHLSFLRGVSHPLTLSHRRMFFGHEHQPSRAEPGFQAKSASSRRSNYSALLLTDHVAVKSVFSDPERTKTDNAKIEGGANDCLSYLLAELQSWKPDQPPSAAASELVHMLLHFDHSETARNVRTISDAQSLINCIFWWIDTTCFPSTKNTGLLSNLARLALEIYSRIPVLPLSLFIDGNDIQVGELWGFGRHGKYGGKEIDTMVRRVSGISSSCQSALIWGTLCHDNILPLLGIFEKEEGDIAFAYVFPRPRNGSLREWRQKSDSATVHSLDRILEVAKALRWMHSLGIVPDYNLTADNIFLDCNFRSQIIGSGLSVRYLNETRQKYVKPYSITMALTYEHSVFVFGCLFYEVYFNVSISLGDLYYCHRKTIISRPIEPEIHDNAWQLIQRCCSEDPNDRPTMALVVEEMESW